MTKDNDHFNAQQFKIQLLIGLSLDPFGALQVYLNVKNGEKQMQRIFPSKNVQYLFEA